MPASKSDAPVASLNARIAIAGGGLAGLFTALKLAPLPVIVISPLPLGEGAASAWAQGGIAAAVGEGDTAAAHAADTIAVGGGLVDPAVAESVAAEAGDRVRDLLAYGVPFDRDLAGHYLLSREAAHSAKRVVRVSGDMAGAAIMQALIATVRATPSITVLEGYEVTDLIQDKHAVTGMELRRADDTGRAFTLAPLAATVLATGGIGALFARTTNPNHALGEGIAVAARAGARISDAEFVQFHPTAIDCDLIPTPLASEALRGEGAVLVDRAGRRFMLDVHPDGELAPRDIVARAVHRQIASGNGAYLDCRAAIGAAFKERFPTVYAKCLQAGIDPIAEAIPVTPAAHYHMGGIETDMQGRSSVAGLWAIGEVARTGLHGANRLASNSLLEAVVFGARAAADIAAALTTASGPGSRLAATLSSADGACSDTGELASRIKKTMSAKVGVERNAQGLASALSELEALEASGRTTPAIRNMLLAARFVVTAALRRTESRGGHYRTDFPDEDPSQACSRALTCAELFAKRD